MCFNGRQKPPGVWCESRPGDSVPLLNRSVFVPDSAAAREAAAHVDGLQHITVGGGCSRHSGLMLCPRWWLAGGGVATPLIMCDQLTGSESPHFFFSFFLRLKALKVAAWFLSPWSGEGVYQTGAARLTDVNSIQQLSVRKPVSAAVVNCVWHLKGGRCKPFIGIFSSAWSVHTKRIIIVVWFIPRPQENFQVPPAWASSRRASLVWWFLLGANVSSLRLPSIDIIGAETAECSGFLFVCWSWFGW